MSQTSFLSSHPILFVFDYENLQVTVPTYDPASVASANETCISVRAISEVDGPVTVSLDELLPSTAVGAEVYRGTVATPSREISIVTANYEPVLRLSVPGQATDVAIVVDDIQHPSRVWVQAR